MPNKEKRGDNQVRRMKTVSVVLGDWILKTNYLFTTVRYSSGIENLIRNIFNF